MAPALGFEPRTKWLTATDSPAELCRSVNIYSSLCQDRYNRNRKEMAPALGFEPRTKWLTATYSTAELCRSVVTVLNISPKGYFVNSCEQKKRIFFALFCSLFQKWFTSFQNPSQNGASNPSRILWQACLSTPSHQRACQKD